MNNPKTTLEQQNSNKPVQILFLFFYHSLVKVSMVFRPIRPLMVILEYSTYVNKNFIGVIVAIKSIY